MYDVVKYVQTIGQFVSLQCPNKAQFSEIHIKIRWSNIITGIIFKAFTFLKLTIHYKSLYIYNYLYL